MCTDISIIFSSFLFWLAVDKVPLFKNKSITNSELINTIIRAIGSNVMCSLYPIVVYDYEIIQYSLPIAKRMVPLLSIGYSSYEMFVRQINK